MCVSLCANVFFIQVCICAALSFCVLYFDSKHFGFQIVLCNGMCLECTETSACLSVFYISPCLSAVFLLHGPVGVCVSGNKEHNWECVCVLELNKPM